MGRKKRLVIVLLKRLCARLKNGKRLRRLLDIKHKKNISGIRTKHGNADVTEDHSLLCKKKGIGEPCDLVLGGEFFHNGSDFVDPKLTLDEIIDKIYEIRTTNYKIKRNVCWKLLSRRRVFRILQKQVWSKILLEFKNFRF